MNKNPSESSLPPPPAYEDIVAATPGPSSSAGTVRRKPIARKPLPGQGPAPTPSRIRDGDSMRKTADWREDDLTRQLEGIDLEAESAFAQDRPPISLRTSFRTNITDSAIYASPARTDTGTTGTSMSPSDVFSESEPASSPSTISSGPSAVFPASSSALSTTSIYLQKGYREARHFAGGLLHHPFESTKHFSILRHSHGLVFYQGPSTSLSISIFADAPLPEDRTFWLQSKGWTGKTGMRARALVGRNGRWLDVTPLTRASAEQLNPSDERAWQRDISKFQKRAIGNMQERHRLRETAILRIPIEAEDGYFRVMLCQGDRKKILCPSPVFRILSTSTSPSSIRGASLSTLPLELGAKILASTARTATGNVVAPITQNVQNAIQPYTPPSWVDTGASMVYDASGAADVVDTTVTDANDRYDQMRGTLFTPLGGEIPTSDDGPRTPYPIKFVGCIAPGSGNNSRQLGMPTANLTAVPEDIRRRLRGYYFGWARFQNSKQHDLPTVDGQHPWYQAVISALSANVTQLARVKVAGPQETIAVYMIQDFEGASFFGAQLEVRIMGFIRSHDSISAATAAASKSAGDESPIDREEATLLAAVNDVAIAQLSLDRPAWGPEPVLERVKGSGLDEFKTRYAHTRLSTTRQVGRVPFHRAGLRTPFDELREKAIVNGGLFVVR
ncbi:MAG: hypothetical protein M1818_000007 [Claussenomyces sp. TS43310]|nr:MAG: hypothetical protein M1818_000007 [Claussenomyces sp. TS43310]